MVRKLRTVGVLVAVIGLSCIMTACAPETPRQKYAVASEGFVAAVNTLADLKKAGKLNEKYLPEIEAAMDAGDVALDAWQAVLIRCGVEEEPDTSLPDCDPKAELAAAEVYGPALTRSVEILRKVYLENTKRE